MARYLFSHAGCPVVVTPDLPTVQAVEEWARDHYLYSTDEPWQDLVVLDELRKMLGCAGDPELEWTVGRTLCEEDWFIGPITVL